MAPLSPSQGKAGDGLPNTSGFHSGLEALSTVAAADHVSFRTPDPASSTGGVQLPSMSGDMSSPMSMSRPMTNESGHITLPPIIPNAATIRDQPDIVMSPIDPSLTASSSSRDLIGEATLPPMLTNRTDHKDDEHEISFLLRHYAEVPGHG